MSGEGLVAANRGLLRDLARAKGARKEAEGALEAVQAESAHLRAALCAEQQRIVLWMVQSRLSRSSFTPEVAGVLEPHTTVDGVVDLVDLSEQLDRFLGAHPGLDGRHR